MVAVAVLLHFVFSSFIGVFLAVIFGKLTPGISVVSLLGGTAAAWYFKNYLDKEYAPNLKKLNILEAIVYGFITIAGIRQFAYLCFNSNNSVKSLLANNYGDLPLHITYIKHMASGAKFPPANPIWGFDKLRYPLGIDFYNSLWESLGMPLTGHMFLTGAILTVVSIIMLRWWGKIITVGAFFLNGAWVGFRVFIEQRSADFQDKVAWKNLFVSVFVTQRGYLIAIPLGAFLLKVAYDYLKNDKVFTRNQLLLFSFLWGVMAFFHLHTFIMISLIIGGYLLIHVLRKSAAKIDVDYKSLMYFIAVAVPIGAIFVLYSTRFFQGGSIIHFTPKGWMVHDGNLGAPTVIHLWWKNWGIWSLFIFGLMLVELVYGRTKTRLEWIWMFILFVVFNIVMLAPWDWDNIKVLLWVYLAMVQMASIMYESYRKEKLFGNKWIYYPVTAILCFFLFFSGSVSVHSVIKRSANAYELYKWEQINATAGAVQGIPTDKMFAAEPTFNNPLGFLGYKLVMGYSAHLWSHAIDAGNVENDLTMLFRPNSDWRSITDKLRIDYIFWGPRERAKYGSIEPAWKKELTNVSKVPGYEVYAVGRK